MLELEFPAPTHTNLWLAVGYPEDLASRAWF